jgi:hypothetical protein
VPTTTYLLLMAAAAGAVPAAGVTSRAGATPVEIAIAAPAPDAVAAVRADLRELLARFDVDARYREIGAVDRTEVLRPPAEAPCSLACVWLDLGVSAPGLAIVYISATASEQVVIRRMPIAAGFDEVAREEVSHIVASSIEALHAGRPLPTGGVGAAAGTAVVVSTAPSPPPPPPSSLSRTVLLGLGAGVAREAAAHAALPTLGLSLVVGANERPASPALWLQADGGQSDVAGSPVGLRLRGGDLAALVALAAKPSAHVLARVGLGLGVELVGMTPRLEDSTATGVRLDAAHLQPAAFARAAARLEVRAGERVGIFVAAACDARFVLHRYMIERDGATQVLYEPERFRPWLVVGLDAVLGGGGAP